MTNDRLRVPQDPNYFHAIGLATIAFARLEWDAAWCCERLQPGYINSIEPKRKTAGTIGQDLEALFSRVSDANLRAKIVPFAQEFREVVRERNALLHGKPGTAQNNDQRLFKRGVEWALSDVNAFSDRAVRAGEPLNALLYAELQDPCTVQLNP